MGGGVAGQQGGDRVAGPGLAQRLQQLGDGLRVVEAGVGGGPGGQGGDRVAGPGLAQLPQQLGDGPRVVEAGVGGGAGQPGRVTASPAPASRSSRSSSATAPGSSRLAWAAGSRASQGGDRVAGPGLAQRLQQRGDGPRVVEAGVGGGRGPARAVTASLAPASRSARSSAATARGSSRLAWAAARAARAVTASLGPGLAQRPQQLGDGPRVVEAGVGGGVAGQQGGDRVAGPGLAQRPQQPGDGPRVVEAGVGGGVAGQPGR